MSPIYVPGKVTLAKEFTWNESVWNPSMITTALWLDAADASTITESGGAVSQWDDKSGNGRHVTQATAGSQPTLATNAVNGKSVLDFDGTDLMENDNAALQRSVSGSSLFAVSRLDVNTSGGKSILQITQNTNATRTNMAYNNGLNTGFSAGGRRLASQSYQQKGVSPYSSAMTLNCAVFNFGSATLSLVENGGITLNNATFQDAGITDNDAGAIKLGGSWDGYLAEVIITHSAVSTNTRQRIEGYLAHKWGLTANLPNDHPYKLVGPTP